MTKGQFSTPPGGLGINYSLSSRLRSLPAYAASMKTGSLLDSLEEFIEDGNFTMTVRACPSTQQQNYSNVIPASAMFEDQISVPDGSFLTMIAGVSIKVAEPTTFGRFRVQLFDVGSQSALSNDFVNGDAVTGFISMPPVTNQPFDGQQAGYVQGLGTSATRRHAPYILPSPYSVSSPGQLTVRIVNLETVSVTIDMAFYFACPVHMKGVASPAVVPGVVSSRIGS